MKITYFEELRKETSHETNGQASGWIGTALNYLSSYLSSSIRGDKFQCDQITLLDNETVETLISESRLIYLTNCT